MSGNMNKEIQQKCSGFVESICKEYSGYLTKQDIVNFIDEIILHNIMSHKIITKGDKLIWIFDPELTDHLKKISISKP